MNKGKNLIIVFNRENNNAFDSDENAWNYYRLKYKNLTDDNKFIINSDDKEIEIKVNGECAYNFSEKNCKKIINKINTEKDEQKKKELKMQLERCRVMHHSLPNIMLLPMNGGLNNLKGKLYINSDGECKVNKKERKPREVFDRPDIFIKYISDYYKNYALNDKMTLKDAGKYLSNSIFTEAISGGENFEVLYDILNSINSVNKFCEMFYQIDPKQVRNMTKIWQEPILENIKKYLDDAEAFWKYQMGKIYALALKNNLKLEVNGETARCIVKKLDLVFLMKT